MTIEIDSPGGVKYRALPKEEVDKKEEVDRPIKSEFADGAEADDKNAVARSPSVEYLRTVIVID